MTVPPVPAGFRVAGVHCGIKSDATKEDLSLFVTDGPAVAAGVYTQNRVHAACVDLDRARTPSDRIRVVVVNSGNANACTGKQGHADAEEMLRLAAATCDADASQALVMSTGIIGRHLPMDRVREGIREAAQRLGRDEAALQTAVRGMMTTDQFQKTAGRTIEIDGTRMQLTALAKGAGMIGPNMATMLALVMTDAPLHPETAQQALQTAADTSFNCISVEGHTSTNDTLLLVASGAARREPLTGNSLAIFQHALNEVCIELAKLIPSDGEGATHLITIHVTGCASVEDARRIAQTIANSPLVKTGIAGADPNWGRIVSAAGYAGVAFDPQRMHLKLNGHELFRHGQPVPFDAKVVSHAIRDQHETVVELTLGEGQAEARFWTSDLTIHYVRFNSEYTT
jgi:glutamate N-acetyltransferase/amino-acid N-acetyltransferase